jgi:hypothetical protein
MNMLVELGDLVQEQVKRLLTFLPDTTCKPDCTTC